MSSICHNHAMIDTPSVQSLLLKPSANSNALSTATGFVVKYDGRSYLVTNWHVVSGRNPKTGQPLHHSAAVPDSLLISYVTNIDPQSVAWTEFKGNLYDEAGRVTWFEHPAHGRKVDIVALPLPDDLPKEIILHPYEINDVETRPQLSAKVTDWTYIVGFPFGIAAGGSMAVWTKGSIASEPVVDYGGLPCFLVDARGRPGQSGSPVILHNSGGAAVLENGSTLLTDGPLTNLLGVYSGRINDESDLGIVWKLPALLDILKNGRVGDGSFKPSFVRS